MATEEAALALEKELAGLQIRVAWGEEGLLEAATLSDVDCVITAVVGMIGLKPTLAAIRAGKRIGKHQVPVEISTQSTHSCI